MAEVKIPEDFQALIQRGRGDIVVFAEELLGMKLHEGQKRYLRMAMNREIRLFLLTCANRWGKSVTVAIIQLWYLFYKIGIDPTNTEAWFKEEYRTANCSPLGANTEAVFKTITQIMTSSFAIRRPDGTRVTNKCLIEWFYLPEKTLNTLPYKQYFAFNCYIEHLSLGATQGGTLQGKPYGIITYDEGFRSLHLKVEIDDAIMPRLFDWQGPLHIVSTPSVDKPSTLYAYGLFQKGLARLNDSYAQTGSLKENTFFTPKQIAQQYKLYENNPVGPQVLEGKFVFGGNTMFNAEKILACQDPSLNDGVRFQEGHRYILSIDTAIGTDEIVYNVLDVTVKPFLLVRKIACRGNSKSPQQHLNDLIDLVYAYLRYDPGTGEVNMLMVLETFNEGSARFYLDMPPDLQGICVCYGSWQPEQLRTDNENPEKKATNGIKKADILISMQKALADEAIHYPENDETLAQQLSVYKVPDKGIPTDHVISLAVGVHRALLDDAQEEQAWIDM